MAELKVSRSETVKGNLYETIARMTKNSHVQFHNVTATVSCPSPGNPLSKVAWIWGEPCPYVQSVLS